MGCITPKEKIEDQMMQIKMLKMEIQMDRENKVNQLSQMEGRQITYQQIPDYIDPKFAQEKKIYYGNNTEIIERISKETNEKNNKLKNSTKLKKRSKSKKKKNK